MRIYVDASAAVKLVKRETETPALEVFMEGLESAEPFASILLETELRRLVSRHGLPQEKATKVLQGMDLVDAPRDLFRDAGTLPGFNLRSLDAIHLVTALRHNASVMLAYDQRLLDAAKSLGMELASPV